MTKDKDLNKVMKALKEHYGWSNIEVLPESYVDLVNDVIKATKQVNFISSNPVLAEVPCPYCNGDGFTSEHNDMSRNYETGEHDCSQCPIQVQCEKCMATGKLKIQVG